MSVPDWVRRELGWDWADEGEVRVQAAFLWGVLSGLLLGAGVGFVVAWIWFP